MRRFEVSRITCRRCGHDQPAGSFTSRCLHCHGFRFRVEIERSSWGVDYGEMAELACLGTGTAWGAFAALSMGYDAGPDPFYRTQALLSLEAVDGLDVERLLRAPLEERRRLFVEWKREETESRLLHGEKVCRRCGLIFKPYPNAWHGAGLCSRACHRASKGAQRSS